MRLKKVVLALLLFIAFPVLGSAQELMSRGWIVSSHSNDSDAAPDAGLYFSVPQGQSVTVSMQTSFATTPASVTIQLQTSLDASIWTTVVSSTSTAGETITAYNQVTKYVRANVSARSGGSGVTTQLLANYSYGGSYLSGLMQNNLLLVDGTCPVPALGFNSDNDGTGQGWYRVNAATTGFCINGIEEVRYAQTTLAFAGEYFGLGATVGVPDVHFGRRAANTPITTLGASTYSAATNSVTVGGVLCVNTTAQATTGTVEEVLATCTLPANAMSANGKGIRIKAWFSGTGAGNKTVRLRFGGIGGSILITGTTATGVATYYADAVVIRTGAATQEAFGTASASGTVHAATQSNPAQTLANALDIVANATTAVAGELTFKGMIVEFFN